MDEKNHQVNEPFLPIEQVDWDHDVKIEEDSLTGYVAYAEEAQTQIEQAVETNATGYEVTHEVAMSDSQTGYAEQYLESPKEDEAEVLEIGDRVVEILSGIRGVVVGFLDGRVVFDCSEFGRCSRPAIMLKKVK